MIEMVEQTLEFDIYCHLKIRKKSGLRNIGLRQQRIVFNKRKKMWPKIDAFHDDDTFLGHTLIIIQQVKRDAF